MRSASVIKPKMVGACEPSTGGVETGKRYSYRTGYGTRHEKRIMLVGG